MHRTVMRLEWQRGNLYAARQQFELAAYRLKNSA